MLWKHTQKKTTHRHITTRDMWSTEEPRHSSADPHWISAATVFWLFSAHTKLKPTTIEIITIKIKLQTYTSRANTYLAKVELTRHWRALCDYFSPEIMNVSKRDSKTTDQKRAVSSTVRVMMPWHTHVDPVRIVRVAWRTTQHVLSSCFVIACLDEKENGARITRNCFCVCSK